MDPELEGFRTQNFTCSFPNVFSLGANVKTCVNKRVVSGAMLIGMRVSTAENWEILNLSIATQTTGCSGWSSFRDLDKGASAGLNLSSLMWTWGSKPQLLRF